MSTTNTSRTTVQHFSASDLDDFFMRHVGAEEKFFAALGRLAWWGMPTGEVSEVMGAVGYPTADIYLNSREGEMVAVYSTPTGSSRFVLAAVWHASSQEWGFHS